MTVTEQLAKINDAIYSIMKLIWIIFALIFVYSIWGILFPGNSVSRYGAPKRYDDFIPFTGEGEPSGYLPIGASLPAGVVRPRQRLRK